MDDDIVTERKLEKLGDLPAIDMTMNESDAPMGDLEADDEPEDDQQKMQVDVEEEDPLDAFMSGVKEQVKKVNFHDVHKLVESNPTRSSIRLDDPNVEEDDNRQAAVDELDATDLNPEDILALAAKKAKKKELAAVDHGKMKYEPFRKEFYQPPPDIAAMTDEEADDLRIALDGIKIRGIECPRPVDKWSHFGMPANWYVPCKILMFTFSNHLQS